MIKYRFTIIDKNNMEDWIWSFIQDLGFTWFYTKISSFCTSCSSHLFWLHCSLHRQVLSCSHMYLWLIRWWKVPLPPKSNFLKPWIRLPISSLLPLSCSMIFFMLFGPNSLHDMSSSFKRLYSICLKLISKSWSFDANEPSASSSSFSR